MQKVVEGEENEGENRRLRKAQGSEHRAQGKKHRTQGTGRRGRSSEHRAQSAGQKNGTRRAVRGN